MFLMESCLITSIESKITLNGTLNKVCSQQMRFVSLSNTFIIDFSLDELNFANISFYEMNILQQN